MSTITHTYDFNNIGINIDNICNTSNYENTLNLCVKYYIYNNEKYKFIKYDKVKLNSNNYNTIGLFRSFLCKNNKIVCFAPPKSVEFEKFTSTHIERDCVAEEYVEGTMINLFYDNEQQDWEIATKTTVGGKVNYFNTNKMLFRQMFLEACNDCNLEFDNLNKELCYSFVIQHPNNLIVIPLTEIKLYLVACYKINNSNKTIQAIDVNSIKNNFNNIKIYYPRQYIFDNFEQLHEIVHKLHMDSYVGLMIHHHSTGERTKLRNIKYEYVKKLRGNQAKLQFRYLELRATKQIKEYLYYFPESTNSFNKYETEIHNFTNNLHKYYVNCFISKQIKLKDHPYEYRLNMYELHNQYINILKPKKQTITKMYVIDYINSLPPAKLMFAINYEKRLT